MTGHATPPYWIALAFTVALLVGAVAIAVGWSP